MNDSTPQNTPQQQASPMSIVTGLRACAMETSLGRERRSLLRFAERLAGGGSVVDVLDNDRYVPKYLREMVRAGMKTGQMGKVLEDYISTSKQSRWIWQEFFLSLFYPLVIFMIALTVLGGFVMLTIPGFKKIFEDFGVELPFITQWMIGVSDWMQHYWYIYLLMILLLPGSWLIHRFTPGRILRVRLLQRIPIIGTARANAAASEFCSRLALLIDCQLPLQEALYCVSKSIRDPSLASLSELWSFQIERGQNPQNIGHTTPHVLPALASVFRWSRDPELFSEGLRASSEMFTAQARVRTGQFASFIEPFTVIVIGMGAGFVMLSCFMPLIKLLNELS